MTAADRLPQLGSAIRIRVAGADAPATTKILARHGAEVIRVDIDGDALFLVANREDLSFEQQPSFGLVVRDLQKAGSRRGRPACRSAPRPDGAKATTGPSGAGPR